MSFRYKNTNITLENYREVFHACTPDILDEIRSAILDDTQIGGFIEKCGVDNYKLGQIRMALREMIPIKYINISLSGKSIYTIRKCIESGISIEAILKYYDRSNLLLSQSTIETLLDFIYIGTDITKVDFTQVPTKLVNIICKGLSNGYPMWLLVDPEIKMSEEKVRTLMRGMQLGIDIHPFIYDNWSNEQMYFIFSYSKNVDLSTFLGYVNSNFDVDSLKVLLDLYSKGIPITKLCKRDSDNMPVYNSYQMYAIGEALKDGVSDEKIYNPMLSDVEISNLHHQILENRNIIF